MPRAWRAVERASRVSLLRPCRMLRGFRPRACAAAFQRDRSSADCILRARRDLGLVLYSSPLLRSPAGIATQEALCSGDGLGTFLQAMITIPAPCVVADHALNPPAPPPLARLPLGGG